MVENKKKNKKTIVGSRPPENIPGTMNIPRGIEVLVKKASVDRRFRRKLLKLKDRAARLIGLRLSDIETSIIKSVDKRQLKNIIKKVKVPGYQRRIFLSNTAVAMLAIIIFSSKVTSDVFKNNKNITNKKFKSLINEALRRIRESEQVVTSEAVSIAVDMIVTIMREQGVAATDETITWLSVELSKIELPEVKEALKATLVSWLEDRLPEIQAELTRTREAQLELSETTRTRGISPGVTRGALRGPVRGPDLDIEKLITTAEILLATQHGIEMDNKMKTWLREELETYVQGKPTITQKEVQHYIQQKLGELAQELAAEQAIAAEENRPAIPPKQFANMRGLTATQDEAYQISPSWVNEHAKELNERRRALEALRQSLFGSPMHRGRIIP